MKKKIFFIVVLLLSSYLCLKAQSPVAVGELMPGFTLQSYQGQTVTLSQLQGKNVMLIFPRGKVFDHWCQICHYQYAELADIEQNQKIREKYNLEIIFVLPYNAELVNHWVSIFPDQMDVIDKWKNPSGNLTEDQKNWRDKIRKSLPQNFHFTKDNIPTPFPILIDGNRDLSMKLGLFTTFWDGSYVEQNIPSIFILDKNGTVQFKYISQNTFDRPGFEYLSKIMDALLVK